MSGNGRKVIFVSGVCGREEVVCVWGYVCVWGEGYACVCWRGGTRACVCVCGEGCVCVCVGGVINNYTS